MTTFKQFLQVLLQVLGSIFSGVGEILEILFGGTPTKNTEYKADFSPSSELLSSWNYGYCLTGKRNLTRKDSYQNALVIGGTGVGKSSIVLFPSLYSMKASFIVHDPSGEIFLKTAGYLEQQGVQVKVLNFANPSISSGYNMISLANTSSQFAKIAYLLVNTPSSGEKVGGKDPFWNNQAVSLISMLIGIVKKQEPQYANLYNVRQLLNLMGSNPKSVDALFSRDADEALFSEYKAFIAYDEKVINGIIATAKASLQIFSDEAVAKVTSHSTIDFKEFRERPTVLYIQNSVADQKYYSVLTSLFFEQCFSYLLGRFPTTEEQDVFLLIDEASSLNLPTLPLAVANVRKHRAGIILLIQDFNQLIHNYGKFDADAIKSNCYSKLFFSGLSNEMTHELEQVLGKYEYEDEKTGKKVVRPLMTNNEIRTMPLNRALLICGNKLPVLVRLKPYYKRLLYKGYSELPVPALQSDVASLELPLIPLTLKRVPNHEKAA